MQQRYTSAPSHDGAVATPAPAHAALRAFVAGTYWWNYATITSLFASADGAPVFCRSYQSAIEQATRCGGRVVAWAARLQPQHEASAAEAGVPLVRIEDGFIRSIGLGAGFVPAASLAIDSSGIYYDATRASDLETLLENADISEAQRLWGLVAREAIVAARLSKYNLSQGAIRQNIPSDRPIVLVPGQVTDDASILKARSPTIDVTNPENVNTQLLRSTRARNPDAFIIYKPHPDVMCDLREGGVDAAEVRRYADLVAADADILSLIDIADRVETISSLAGYEALLRGRMVTTHGMPFYAGWGLTDDLAHAPRRTRRRSLDELTYIAFYRYTRHVDPLSSQPCDVLQLIDSLVKLRRSRLHRLRVAGLRRVAWVCERFKLP